MGVLEEFIGNAFYYTIDAPVTFVRDFVDSQRKRSPYYYYHQRFPRVPSIEECAVDDYVCMYEGNMQYKRDRLVDMEILKHLQKVLADCNLMEGPNAKQSCKAQLAEYEEAADGYQGKYGELGGTGNAVKCMMKQKARLMEERRKAREQGKA
ncbi:NADH dehydrogenase [ubiquinone] 1 beta subcomplex subunit 10 [Strongylocentrotus purpuratus]|uniref:NADH dehydrogenase [ubiquinone] 1 beta subcomplex subunit 10 n=1 Tax=Strongylocentrotus purpuratus TaxID=7668 RepID=A0A7M7NST1_STRPU|nr:NADH dehydrogenase [ubiquinone] 1 beta subcomplex subunit 10 [Strongylocentrotus purpuratus]